MRSVVAAAFASACMGLACSSASKPGFSPPADGGTSGSVALPFSLIVKPGTMKVVGQIAGVNLNAHDYAMGLCGQ